jgi:hypothetical protein
VERRFRERCFEQIDLRLPESAQAVARADVERLIDRARDDPPHD